MIHELGDNIIPLAAIGCTFVYLMARVVASTADSMYQASCRSRLKQRLIDRGATPMEIEQVLNAGESPKALLARTGNAPAPPVKTAPYQITS